MRLQKGHQQIKDSGLQLVGVSFDKVESLNNFSKSQKIKYPLLSDPKSKVIKQFGLLNKSMEEGSSKYGIPYPRTLIVDKSGTVLSSIPATVRQRTDVKILLDAWAKVKDKASNGPFGESGKPKNDDEPAG